MPGLSVRAYAEHRRAAGLPGGSVWSVQKALKAGRISRDEDGKIDSVRADAEWELNTNASKRPITDGEAVAGACDVPPIGRSRAIREDYLARLAQLEYEQREGSLISAEKARDEGFELGRAVLGRLLALPARLGPELAPVDDPKTIRQRLEQELREALKQLTAEEP